ENHEAGKSVLLVKETSTRAVYLQRMRRLLDTVEDAGQRKFIVLIRNPFHVYLSEIEARVNWWGHSEAKVSTSTFDGWALRSIRSFYRMLALAERYRGILVSYEYLVNRHHEAIQRLMQQVDVPVSEMQFDFQK